jgi:hypothetical protein
MNYFLSAGDLMSYTRLVLEQIATLDPFAMLHDPTEHIITGSTVFMAKEALKNLDEEKKAYEEALDYMLSLSAESGLKFMILWKNQSWKSIINQYPDYHIDTAWPLGYCSRDNSNFQRHSIKQKPEQMHDLILNENISA